MSIKDPKGLGDFELHQNVRTIRKKAPVVEDIKF